LISQIRLDLTVSGDRVEPQTADADLQLTLALWTGWADDPTDYRPLAVVPQLE